MPKKAIECLTEFITEFDLEFTKKLPIKKELVYRLPVLQIRLTALCALRSRFEFYLANLEDQIRATTDRALMHLQRCIVVDSEYRKKWEEAFKNETLCEKLGAVHLLWHGIWAFKVDAKGGRTDLVMGDRIDNPSKVEETAFGMVLSEWKRAETENEVRKKI
ncbi:MAG: hypothetical protein ACFFDN_17100 [Candidatus Hodarchaeota archaeon]